MADKTFDSLTDGTPISTDILPYVSDPAGTKINKKTTVAHLGNAIFPAIGADNDFIVASSSSWVKKTLAEVLTILGKAAASGLASLNASSKVVQDPANATATATASKIPIADGSGKLDTWISDSSDTVKGKVELATSAETQTGTDTARAVTPAGLASVTASETAKGLIERATASECSSGTDDERCFTPYNYFHSNMGRRTFMYKLVDDSTSLTTGDGKLIFPIPTDLDGYDLVDADAMVSTVSSSGTPTYQIRNVTDSVDMLSTAITIDANENTSYTAATAPVIDTAHDDVSQGDLIAIDKDVAGTGCKGDTIILVFRKH